MRPASRLVYQTHRRKRSNRGEVGALSIFSAQPKRLWRGRGDADKRHFGLLQRRADARQMMPTVAERVVLDYKLCGHRRAEAEGKWRSLIQFFVRKLPHSSGCCVTVK